MVANHLVSGRKHHSRELSNQHGVKDQSYGREGTPIFTGVFEPLARVALYPTDEDGLGTWFAAA